VRVETREIAWEDEITQHGTSPLLDDKPGRTRAAKWRLYHLLGVILASSGIAATAYAGVRLVVDQRIAALYQDRPAMGVSALILGTGLAALATGAALILTSDRHM
jgi:hypothetical protein